MGRIDKLAERYGSYIALPWQKDLAGAQRAIFIVYDKTDERRLRARIGLFDLATTQGGHRWLPCDLAGAFADWMASTSYRDSYFESPEDLHSSWRRSSWSTSPVACGRCLPRRMRTTDRSPRCTVLHRCLDSSECQN